MSTSVKVTGFLYAEQLRYSMHGKKEGEFAFHMLPYKNGDAHCWGACLGPVEFNFTIPEGLDIAAETIKAKVKALEEEKAEAGREYAKKVAYINEQLSKLQAIAYQPEAA